MFSALHKKYDSEITKYWDSQVPTNLLLITISDVPAHCLLLTTHLPCDAQHLPAHPPTHLQREK